jgi:hypothetical protein
MSAALIQVASVEQKQGNTVLHFFRLDSVTRRPAGEAFISSPVTSIEPVGDAFGAVHQGDEAMVAIKTQSGSCYLAMLQKEVVNALNRRLGKTDLNDTTVGK